MANSDHSNSTSKSKFSLQILIEILGKCTNEDGDIEIDIYNECFEELNKMFHLLGTIFGFIVSDVKQKIGILADYRAGEDRDQYATVQSMVAHEVATKTDLRKVKGKPPTGARTLLRLHRALAFIIRFLGDLHQVDGSHKLGGLASSAYNDTLAKHHIWLIRKTVSLALMTLPTRDELLERMGEASVDNTLELLEVVVEKAQPLYDQVQAIYSSNDLLNLP